MVVLAVILLAVFIVSSNFVSASFTKGNLTASIEENYAPGDAIKGWINISLQNEPANSMLKAFNSNISISDFLGKLTVNYDCSPINCEDDYSASSESTTKTFSLNHGQEKVIGLKLNGILQDDSITQLSFKVSSDAESTCYNPLQIDFLNNGLNVEEDYWFFGSTNDFICSPSTGCFNPSETLTQYDIDTTEFCEKIILEALPLFEIGAYIVKGTTSSPQFKMRVYNLDREKLAECNLPAIQGAVGTENKTSCVVSLNLTEKNDYLVCLKADSSTDYEIKAENVNPCGFYGIESEDFTNDYNVFVKGGKYSDVGSFNINSGDSLESELNYYLENKYSNNCSQGCVIPMKFISGRDQEITLANLDLQYKTTSGPTSTNKFYNTEEISAKINSGFLKLDLEKANLLVPSTKGSYTARISLNDVEIASQEISVSNVSQITGINTKTTAAAVSTKFIVYVSGNLSNYAYTWNFGDNTAEQKTTTNSIYHTYASIGTYTLKIEVEDKYGTKSSKEFSISVGSPKEIANLTLTAKRKNLNDVSKQLGLIVGWYKSKIEKQAGLDDLDSELKTLERKYEIASTTSEYVEIMSSLTKLEIPYALQVSESSSGDYFPDVNQINPSYLTEVDKEVDSPSNYKNVIVNWFNENIDMTIEKKTYGLYYGEDGIGIKPLVTIFVLNIKPIQDFSRESYLIIDKSYDLLSFKENYNEKSAGQATAITFSELNTGQEKTIEFVVSEEVSIFDLPIYISPQFSQLPEAGVISPCNFNNNCEPELDETWKNCRNDCKPWGWVFIWMIILLFFAFIAYIILQEWYKRYYETHLFKNKNELYNLIYFINNALNQSYSIEEIIKTLKKHGWKTEQIAYALKKVKGERTGMWEIPVFKWLEKRKIDEEIRKRQQMQTLKKSFQQNPR